jgi:hypothetical protein
MTPTRAPEATDIRREFEGASWVDRRLEERLVSLAERIRPCRVAPRLAASWSSTTRRKSSFRERSGAVGWVAQSERPGVLASLAVAGDGSRRPLGVSGVHTWVRESLKAVVGETTGAGKMRGVLRPSE